MNDARNFFTSEDNTKDDDTMVCNKDVWEIEETLT